MSEKINIDLRNVQITLLLPLWGLNSASEISAWNNKIEVVKEYPMFRKMLKGLKLKNKIVALLSDHYKIMNVVHLRILNS